MIRFLSTIGEIAEIYDGPHATPKKTKIGPYFLSISSLNQGRLDLSKSAHLNEDDFKKWTKRVIPQKGDLLFSYETRLGEAALMPDNIKACLGRRMGLLRPKNNKVIPEYLLYAYLSPYFQQIIIRNKITGATVDRIALSEMKNFPIRIPPIEEQKEVSSLLGVIDKKIELNNKISNELEAMAKLIYDYWFVQFDFPDANGKPYKSSGGKMVFDNKLKREIPEDWESIELSDIANITMGQSPPGDSYNDDCKGHIFFQGSTDFGWRFPKVRKYTTKATRLAKKGDVLLSVRAPVGTLNIADKDCCIGRGLAALHSKQGFDSYLFYVMVYFKQIFDFRNNSGTTFGSITKDDLFSLKLVLPPKKLLEKYNNQVSKINEKILNNHKQNQQLTKLRDWLLPMLMNGQVCVKE